jgi:hypothetical protein
MSVTKESIVTSPLERFLAIFAVVGCLILTIVLWVSISSYQAMWPLPGLYFLEIVILSIVSGFMAARGDPRAPYLTWGTAGVIGVFSILAALSVGMFYFPVALLFAVLSVSSDVRNKKNIPAHLGVFLMAGIAQFALILAAI